MESIAIVYGTNSGNTEKAANIINEKLGNNADLIDVASLNENGLENYKNIILGTSTWGIGDLQDDWEMFLPTLEKMDLKGKNIALFGLGDSFSYPDSFVDGMGTIYDAIKDNGCNIVGQCETSDYSYDVSTAIDDDLFVGLPLDEDNESDLTDQRIAQWVEKLTADF